MNKMKIGDLLFVYGTLRTYGWNAIREQDADFISVDTVRGTLYDLGAFPGLTLEGTGTVEGDVFKITNSGLSDVLDRYEGVDVGLYRRQQTQTDSGLIVWVYVFDRTTRGCNRIASGVWEKV